MSWKHVCARLLALLMITFTFGAVALSAPANADPTDANSQAPGLADESQASADEPVRGVNLEAEYDATISGLVYDQQGNLLDNIQVEAVSAEDPEAHPIASDLTYEYENVATHGTFRLHVPTGTYRIRFSTPDSYAGGSGKSYETLYYGGGAGTDVTVEAGENLELDNVSLTRDTGAPVTGVVTVMGVAKAGVEVALMRKSSYYGTWSVDWTETDNSGRYTFPRVNRGQPFTVRAWNYSNGNEAVRNLYLGGGQLAQDAQTFTLPSGSTGTTLTTLDLPRGVKLSGSVLGANGQPVENADVELFVRNSQGEWDYLAYTDVCSDCGDGTSEGYSFGRVLPGATYTVAAYSDYNNWHYVYLGDVPDTTDPGLVSVTPTADTTLRDINLPEVNVRVSGTVVDEQGDPVKDVRVRFYRQGDVDDGTPYWSSSAWTNQNGQYVANLPEGARYTVGISDSQLRSERWLGNVDTYAQATWTETLTVGHPVALDPITVRWNTTVASGTVRDADGDPVADARVTLWVYEPDHDEWYDYDSTRSTSAGAYKFRGIQPGASFTVSAESPELAMERRFVGDAERVELAESFVADDSFSGTIAPITLTVPPNSIVGTLTTSDGAPLGYREDGDEWTETEAEVRLYEFVGDAEEGYTLEWRDSRWTYSNRYAFADVSPGTYAVRVSSSTTDVSGTRSLRYATTWTGNGSRPASPESPGVIVVTAGVARRHRGDRGRPHRRARHRAAARRAGDGPRQHPDRFPGPGRERQCL